MIEELVRIENGSFKNDGSFYLFDMSVSRGECVGVYTNDHRTSGTAYMGIFGGQTDLVGGKAFCCGVRSGYPETRRWIRANTMIIDRRRFASRELTATDYLLAIGAGRGALDKKDDVLLSREALDMKEKMGITFPWSAHLTALSMLDYYRLAAYKAWLLQCRIIVLDRITEILRRQDLHAFMDCVLVLQGQGAGVFLLDMDENFIFRYANRIDVLKNRRTCYHLYPEEYGERLYDILGWEKKDSSWGSAADSGGQREAGAPNAVLVLEKLRFDGLSPMTFSIGSGEIGFLQDENYRTASCIRSCVLGDLDWTEGSLQLDQKTLTPRELRAEVGHGVAVQIEMPDRSGGVPFDNLTALENLSIVLIPKAGKHFVHKNLTESILDRAAEWFDRDRLLSPIRKWSLPERLQLSYLKWYLLNPKLLICLFPFSGQESIHHEMIINMLVRCARRGMAVWIISSGIDEICEKTANEEFLKRLRYLA